MDIHIREYMCGDTKLSIPGGHTLTCISKGQTKLGITSRANLGGHTKCANQGAIPW
jgi:hypothetical protein